MEARFQVLEAQDRSLSPVSGMTLDYPHRIQGGVEKIRVPRIVCDVWLQYILPDTQAHAGILKHVCTHPRADWRSP